MNILENTEHAETSATDTTTEQRAQEIGLPSGKVRNAFITLEALADAFQYGHACDCLTNGASDVKAFRAAFAQMKEALDCVEAEFEAEVVKHRAWLQSELATLEQLDSAAI
jgi:hypothetical protein